MPRLKAVNNYSVIALIDNTEKNITDQVYLKGYSELERLVNPNQAVIIESEVFKPGSIVFLFEFGIKTLDSNRQIVDNKSIIMANNKLLQDGVIVKKTTLPSISKGFELREGLEYFQVVISNKVDIKPGAFIIISKRQCQRLNIEKLEFFFVWPKAIALVFDKDGFKAGPEFILADLPEEKTWINSEPCYCLYKDNKVYYRYHEFELSISGQKKRLIDKSQIFFTIID